MGQKLHHSRRYSRRKTAIRPIIGWVVAAAVLIPASYFGARYLGNRKSDVAATTPATQTTVTDAPVTTTPAPTVEATALRGVTLPYTALRDTAALKLTCKAAADAGNTCAVVELKTETGALHYASETDLGKAVGAQTEGALTLAALTDAFAAMREAGLTPVARLFAFKDATAPKKLADAKITTTGHADWTWYDGDPQNGGKPWLNPYSDAAQTYIVSLAEELYTAGAGALLLDGVCFPTQTAQAQLAVGNNAALSKAEVLKQFITRVHNLREDAPLLLCGSVNAFLGNNTAGFDGNPRDFGCTAIVPDLRLSALGKRLVIGDKKFTPSDETLADITAAAVAALKAADGPTVVPLIGENDAVKAAAGNAYIVELAD
ncbi:MAG: hypothetical protein DBY18_03210 [Clostridia bacterium]|nr:MAG: hypothetical protein DBY18_03210 [Clostridia bacterium]